MSVVISSDLVLGGDVPAQNARIGYKKITGTITASSTADGYDSEYPDNYLTYNFWKPDSLPATWEIDAGVATECNYVGIAAHEIGSSGCSVYAEYYDGSEWQEISGIAPADDSPIMFIFSKLSWVKYRIRIAGSTAPRVGVVFMGVTLDMQRAIYGNHSPLNLSRVTTVTPALSETGQFIGRTIQSYGVSTSWTWSNLTPAWYRSEFDPFVKAARTQPFFIAWRPSQYSEEVGYCWTSKDISPTNNGTAGLMNVTLSATGLGNE